MFPDAFDVWWCQLYDKAADECRNNLGNCIQELTNENTELRTELESEQAHVQALVERINMKQFEVLALKAELERRRSAAESDRPSPGGPVTLRRYSLREMAAATGDFAPGNVLGVGGFGTVYRGEIDHVPVAIKVLNEDGMQGRNEFDQEVEVHCRVRHPHIVMLLGSCSEEKLCLVYDLMPNGSLEDRLLQAGGANAAPLTWQARVRIATEVATALLYLHSAQPAPIIHRDVKPGNILLDRNLTGKLGDVGLAVIAPQLAPGTDLHAQTHISSPGGCGIGTFAYIDPEFMNEGRFGPASDVFSFGQVLLQLLTGKSPLGLQRMVSDAMAHSTLSTVLDSAAGWPDDLAMNFAVLAVGCTETTRTARPSLRERIVPELSAMRAEAAAAEMVDSIRAHGGEIPHKFLCPISRDIMEEPVLAADGNHYDRAYISMWLRDHNTSPFDEPGLFGPNS